ncbi:glycosyltransferase [Magnetospirillum sp. SS-4]|uniref:glycosyltransferase n=1 Tax=Magnetospirillum sp. SS-4 TaxID=2681465 RepID=UPI001382E5D6|nr:glycosyltransferase [Magnetospirillum sp. SS-4]CAA7622909.1 hypothetical protein MTBSS4_40023 [Magnetospirillum sp. SS-4]
MMAELPDLLADALFRHRPNGGRVRAVGVAPSDFSETLFRHGGLVLADDGADAAVVMTPWRGDEADIPSVLSELSAGLADAAVLVVPLSDRAEDDHAGLEAMLPAYGFAVTERTARLLIAGRIPETLRLYRRLGGRRPDRPWHAPAYAPYAREPVPELAGVIRGWKTLLSLPAAPVETPRSACFLIYGIEPGGAERQICMLAAALHDRGWTVRILTIYPHRGQASHYLDSLAGRAIPVSNLPHPLVAADAILAWARDRAPPHVLGALRLLPPQIMHAILATWRDLEADRPELLLGFLDADNLRCALAGLLAGIRHVVMCGRSVHPGHFPANYHDVSEVMASVYRLVLAHSRVRMLCNSRAGAASYAGWLGIAPERIGILPNSVRPAAPHDRREARQRLGLAENAKVVAGLFRLSPEKRPDLFLAVIARLVRRFPDLVAIIVGDGILRGETERAIARMNLGGTVRLLGIRRDVEMVLAASDLLLHVSRVEGMPNALLEAQMQHCPVVATAGGGTAEAVMPPLRQGLCRTSDPDDIAMACARLLDAPAQARRLAAEAAEIVVGTFTPERSAEALLAALDQA